MNANSTTIIQNEIYKYQNCANRARSEASKDFYTQKVNQFKQVLNDLKAK